MVRLLPIALVGAEAVFVAITVDRGWIVAVVQAIVGLAGFPFVRRSRTTVRFVMNSVTFAIGVWLLGAVVLLIVSPPN
jgi:hypothetical protein